MEVEHVSLLSGERVDVQEGEENSTSPTVIVKTLGSLGRGGRPIKRGGGGDSCQCCALSLCCGELCFGSRSGRVWCVNDICGILCAVLTWVLILYGASVCVIVLLLSAPNFPLRFIHICLFLALAVLAFLSHVRAMCTDPGAVPIGNASREKIVSLGLVPGQVVYKCARCDSIKPVRTHHCSICKRCIRKMDHHCPWVNNCVGESNQKYFVLFTMYIFLLSGHSIYVVLSYFYVCIGNEWEDCRSIMSPAATTVFGITLAFEGLLFGLFTMIMCIGQLWSIFHDQTGIERLKKVNGESPSQWYNFYIIFGGPPSWRWLSPLGRAPNGTWPLSNLSLDV